MAKQRPSRPAPVPPAPRKPVPKKVESRPKREPVRLPTDAVWWFGLVAAALGFVLYINTLGHQYALDDYGCLKDNYIVQGGLKNIGTMFSTEYRYGYKAWNSIGSLYRPAVLTMFAAEWKMAPDNPFFYHLMNVLWFALTGWLLWATWRRVLADYPAVLPALAVLFFMAHPIHVEAVANIKSRDEIMSLFLCTASLYAVWRYLERENSLWLVGAMLLYGMAFFFKESTITFLAVFPLAIWFFSKKPIETALKITGLMLIPTGIFLFARMKALGDNLGKEIFSVLDNFIVGASDPLKMFASGCMMSLRYIQTLVFPNRLVSDLGYPQSQVVGFDDWRAILGFLLLFGGGIWAVLNIKNRRFLAFAVLFFLGSFSLYTNVLKKLLIGTSYGERLMYVPSLGFALALAWAICKIFKLDDRENLWNPNGKGIFVWGIAGAILLFYSFKTITRNPVWYDSASLYAADIGYSKNCAKLNYHHALELAKSGYDEKADSLVSKIMLDSAVATYSNAIRLYPDYHDAYGSRGTAYLRMKQYDKALEDYNTALKYRATDAKVLSNMAFIYMQPVEKGGKWDPGKAIECYQKAIKADPRFVDGRRNMGAILAMQRRFPEAIEQWKEGLKIEPNNLTLLNYIASAYRDNGQPEEARIWFEKFEAAKRLPPARE